MDRLGTDMGSIEQFDHNLLSQKDTLEKDARSELDEMIAKRLNFPGEMEPLIQDMVNKKSSSQAENVEFESSDTEDTGNGIYSFNMNTRIAYKGIFI